MCLTKLISYLLVPPLNGALSLVEVDGVAVLVSQHLDLNVAGFVHEFLDEHPEKKASMSLAFSFFVSFGISSLPVIVEEILPFLLADLEGLHRLGVVPRDAHALAALEGEGGFCSGSRY